MIQTKYYFNIQIYYEKIVTSVTSNSIKYNSIKYIPKDLSNPNYKL